MEHSESRLVYDYHLAGDIQSMWKGTGVDKEPILSLKHHISWFVKEAIKIILKYNYSEVYYKKR